MFRILGVFIAGLMISVAMPAKSDGISIADKDPAYLTLSAGWFDFNRRKDQAAEFSVEYRSDWNWWVLKPFFHGAYATNGMTFLGAGLLMDIQLGDNWIVQPSFAPTWWRGKTDDLDLGNPLEFRSRVEIAYRFPDKSRLGLSVSHSSNGGLGGDNPGTESVMLNVSFPLGR